jgi:protein TorT
MLTQKIALYKTPAEIRICCNREIETLGRASRWIRAGMGRESVPTAKHSNLQGGLQMKRSLTLAASAAALVTISVGALAASGAWFPYKIEVWEKAFDMASPRHMIDYTPLEKASQKWKICVSFPHMKDDYWLAVDYGAVDEAKRLGVAMQVLEAGGYTELNKQISQIENCVAGGAQAVIIGAISFDGLNNLVGQLAAKNIPVVDVINGISSDKLAAKSLVSFGEMGGKAGEYLVKLHPKGGEKAKVAWFPGPAGAGWVEAGHVGFTAAVKEGEIEIVDTKYGDTGKEAQLALLEDALTAHPDVNYIVGTAVTAEAAMQLVSDRGLEDQVKIRSYYFTRGRILAAPTDSAVIQARVAVDQAVRILEGKEYEKHVGPQLYVIDSSNVETFDRNSSLAPAEFKPEFGVN